MGTETKNIERKPEWLNKKIRIADNIKMKSLLSQPSLHTICEEALCPNISECFCKGHASFLILGAICTRGCSFCNVNHSTPLAPDSGEPELLAQTVSKLKLKHVVITSPTRDDLPDGGASHYVESIKSIRNLTPDTKVEVLIPDFMGDTDSLQLVLQAKPDILGHNLETVKRLYFIRKGADYSRSISLLKNSRILSPDIPTKSGIMVGLGETPDEVLSLFEDLVNADCSFLSIGQYLAPKNTNYKVQKYVNPEQFELYKEYALSAGIRHVESSPYVRSSYNADKYLLSE